MRRFALVLGLLCLSASAQALTLVDNNASSTSLELGAEVYGRLRARQIDDASLETPFDLSRARLKFSLRFGSWLRADVEPDFGGAQADIADVFLQVQPIKSFDVRLGQAKVPFGFLESTGRWHMPSLRRGMVNKIVFDRLGFSVRRVGVRARLRLSKVALRPTVEAGLYGEPDSTFAEHAAGRMSIRLHKGTRLALAGYSVARVSENDGRGQVGAVSLLMNTRKFFAGAEVQVGRASLLAATGLNPGRDATFIAARAVGAYRFELGPDFTLQPYAVLEFFESNLNTIDDLSYSGRSGVNLIWLERLRMGIEGDYQDGQSGAVILKQIIATAFVGVRLE